MAEVRRERFVFREFESTIFKLLPVFGFFCWILTLENCVKQGIAWFFILLPPTHFDCPSTCPSTGAQGPAQGPAQCTACVSSLVSILGFGVFKTKQEGVFTYSTPFPLRFSTHVVIKVH